MATGNLLPPPQTQLMSQSPSSIILAKCTGGVPWAGFRQGGACCCPALQAPWDGGPQTRGQNHLGAGIHPPQCLHCSNVTRTMQA